MIEIRQACYRDACFVVAHMRPRDEEEIMCQVADGTKRHELAYGLLMSGLAFTAHENDVPVAFFGFNAVNVACLNAWAVGTKRMHRAIPEVTRFLIRDVLPGQVEAGIRSMEARTHVNHKAAHRWLEGTGAVVSGPPFVYGKNGEKFLMYRWHAEDLGPAAERYKVDRT